jgi:hypothetical protein
MAAIFTLRAARMRAKTRPLSPSSARNGLRSLFTLLLILVDLLLLWAIGL